MNRATPRVRLKPIALPSEHGSWGFLFEPILLGVALAPSFAGFVLALAVVATFLLRNPLRIFLRGRGRGMTASSSPRLVVARRIAAAYAALAVVSGVAGIALAGVRAVWPLLVVSPLAVVYLVYDSRNRGRSLSAELFGPIGLAAAAPAIVLTTGWSDGAAVALWVIVVIKAFPTVHYVRARLRLEDGQTVRTSPALWYHAAALVVAVGMVWWALAPWPTAAVVGVLAARAAVGLSRYRRPSTPKQIGVLEFVYSGLYVVATAVGYYAAA